MVKKAASYIRQNDSRFLIYTDTLEKEDYQVSFELFNLTHLARMPSFSSLDKRLYLTSSTSKACEEAH